MNSPRLQSVPKMPFFSPMTFFILLLFPVSFLASSSSSTSPTGQSQCQWLPHPSVFPPCLSEPFSPPLPASSRSSLRLSARFQDYDENLTSAKVVSVRRISHFSETHFSASPSRNSRGRMASKIVFLPPLLRVTS